MKKMFFAAATLALLSPVAARISPHAGAASAATFDASARRVKPHARVRHKMNDQKRDGAEASDDTWGGEHATLRVRAGGADVEFDCAHGEISEPLKPDAGGKFDLPGTLVGERGPIRLGITRVAQSARYSGRVEGRSMTLSVRLADTDQTLNTYTLTRGREGLLHKCR